MESSQDATGGCRYECIVCLENLNCNAPLTVLVDEGELGGPVNRALVGLPPVIPTRGQRQAEARRAQAKLRITNIDKKEIVATPCGHVYHRYCLETWFLQEKRKTCPNCRKVVPVTKLRQLDAHSVGHAVKPVANLQTQGVTAPALGTATGSSALGPPPEPIAGPSRPDTSLRPGAVSTPIAGSSRINMPFVPPRIMPLPDAHCQATCSELPIMHEALIKDFNSLQERYFSTEDQLALRRAQLHSLQESFDAMSRQLSEHRASHGSTSTATS